MEITKEVLEKSDKYRLTQDELKKVMVSFVEASSIHKMGLPEEQNKKLMDAVVQLTIETAGTIFCRHWTDYPEMFEREHVEHEMMRGEDFKLNDAEMDEITANFVANSNLSELNITQEEKIKISAALTIMLGEIGCTIYDHYAAVHGTPPHTQFKTPRTPNMSIYDFALSDNQINDLVEQTLLKQIFVTLGQRARITSDELDTLRSELIDVIMSANALILYDVFGKEEIQKQMFENTPLYGHIFGNKEQGDEKKEE